MKDEELRLLLSALGSDEPARAIQAAYQAYAFGIEAGGAAAALVRNLGHPDAWVVGWSAIALGQMGPEARECQPVLISLLKHENEFVRSSVAATLGKLRVDEAVQPLVCGLRDRDPKVRAACAKALLRIGSVEALGALRSTRKNW